MNESLAQTYRPDLVYSDQKSKLLHRICIVGVENFSRPYVSKRSAVNFFEVPLKVEAVTLSIPILPLTQYWVEHTEMLRVR